MKTARRAFTLVEATLSLLIVSVVATAALTAVAQARSTRALAAERSLAVSLARSLIDEIATMKYAEPQSPSAPPGLDAGETTTPDRTTLDDVDDYHGFVDNPPRERSGTLIPDASLWRREVVVDWVESLTPTSSTTTESGVKRVRVDVYHRHRLVLSQVMLRTKVWDAVVAGGGL